MSTADHSPLSAVEAFVHGQIDRVALEDELDDCCAKDEGAAWDALALLDQFYRRGRIADADFRVLMKRVNRHAQKPLGAASHPASSKDAKARSRSTLTVPVGNDLPAADASATPAPRVSTPPISNPTPIPNPISNPPTADSVSKPAGKSSHQDEPQQTQLLHPEVLDLDLDVGLARELTSRKRDARRDTELADLPPMHTRELPAQSEPLAKEPDESAQMRRFGRAEPTVMLDLSHDDLMLGAVVPLDELPEPAPSHGRDSAPRSVEPTMHEGHRVLRDRFELGPLLGRGGMASVFQARDRHREGASEREQWVAVKVLNDGVIRADEGAKALQREFQHVQMLTHPGIVKVLDFDYDGATPFLVMELLEGESLESRLARGERCSRPVALALVHHLAVALGYAHSNDIVHADFKPGNVMVMPSGQVKILDLGVSWRWQREPRMAAEEGRGQLLATPAYASPEVLNGGLPEVRDDIFSLGCLAYELLMGEHPFRRIPITKAVAQGLQPKRISWLTRPQWRTLASSLSFHRDARPASVQAFLDGLGLRGEPPVLPPPSQWSAAEISRWPTVIRVGIAVAASALLAIAVVPQFSQWLRGIDLGALATVPSVAAPPSVSVPPTEPVREQAREPARAPARRSEPPAVAQSKPAPVISATEESAAPVALAALPAGAKPAEPKPVVSAPPVSAAPATPTPTVVPTPPTPAIRNEAAAAATAALAPTKPGRIAFANETFRVSERDSVARIELVRRQGSQGKVGVRWETEDITALKDTDYADMGEQIAWFDNGQTRLTLLVPLVVGGEPKDLRAFRVRIKSAEGGAELTEATEAMVVISP